MTQTQAPEVDCTSFVEKFASLTFGEIQLKISLNFKV